MSIVIKCQMCDHTHPFNPADRPYERDIPDDWLILYRGDPQTNTAFDFCSEKCLMRWTSGLIEQEESDKKSQQLKTHHFIMYDAVHDEQPFHGALWPDGHVELDGKSWHCSSPRFHCNGYFESMDLCKEHHPDYEIFWIDQRQAKEKE